MWLAENTGRKKVAKDRHLGTIAQFCWAIFSQLRHISTIGKNLLSSNTSSTCLHNMVNFGSLPAEIGPVVWGTPCKLQRVSHLGSVTARHCSSGRQPNFVVLNRGRHLYSAGRPSRWALAHISTIDLKFRDHFTLRTSSTTRGHDYKLFLTYSRLNARKRFFCERVVPIWNNLECNIIRLLVLNVSRHLYYPVT